MSAGWKKNVEVGECRRQAPGADAHTYSDVGGACGPALSEIRISPSTGPMVPLVAEGQVDGVRTAGRCCRGSWSSSRDGMISPDLLFHPGEDTLRVSSMRVPAGARTCRRICPASTCGKKSSPNDGQESDGGDARSPCKQPVPVSLRCAQRPGERVTVASDATVRSARLKAWWMRQKMPLPPVSLVLAAAGRCPTRCSRGSAPWSAPACARAGRRPASRTPRPSPAA